MTDPSGFPTGPPAGWYPDPSGQPVLRWWDGATWREQTQVPPSPGMQPMPYPGYGYPAPATRPAGGNGYSTAGIILGSVAFLFFPIICGPVGLVMGGIAKSRGESRADTALIVSGLGLVVGLILGIVAFSNAWA